MGRSQSPASSYVATRKWPGSFHRNSKTFCPSHLTYNQNHSTGRAVISAAASRADAARAAECARSMDRALEAGLHTTGSGPPPCCVRFEGKNKMSSDAVERPVWTSLCDARQPRVDEAIAELRRAQRIMRQSWNDISDLNRSRTACENP